MIQIKGQYTAEDFKKAQQLHAQQGATAAGTRIFLLAVVVLFYISLIILVLLGRLHWLYLLAPLALLAVFLLFQYLYRPFVQARTFKKHKELSAPFEWELSELGLSITNPNGNALVAWNEFKKWVEGKELILLYRSYNMFQMLPKRLFARESDLQYLRDQLTRNAIPDARKANPRISTGRLWVYIILFMAIAVMLYLNIRSVPR
jgi:hypothetical protein